MTSNSFDNINRIKDLKLRAIFFDLLKRVERLEHAMDILASRHQAEEVKTEGLIEYEE